MFKKALSVGLLFLMISSLVAYGTAGQKDTETVDVSENSSYESAEGTQIKMITENTEVVITLNDSRAAGDFGYWNAGPDLAIFYDDIYEQTIVEVIPLGHAETGAETMANESGTVRLKLVSEEGE